MERIAEFYKISYEQFEKDYKKLNPNCDKSDKEIKQIYDGIKLPKRATVGSAGYDFFLPYDIELKAGEEIGVATGIRVKCDPEYAMLFMNKSGLGSKNRFQLNTCISLIDSDYYYSDNEGHIMAFLIHDSRVSDAVLSLPAGKSFLQGVFFKFGITQSDECDGKRNGGFGSTK